MNSKFGKPLARVEQIQASMINCQESDADLIFYNDFGQIQRRSGSIPEHYKSDIGSGVVVNNNQYFIGRQIIRSKQQLRNTTSQCFLYRQFYHYGS